MSTQQDIYAAGSESRPPMLNKENYVPWSSRLLRYAKSRPNGKLIHNSIINGPYVRRMILEPGDVNCEVTVTETFHVQTNDELTDKELKQIETDDQAIQTILLGLPEDIYAAVDSCETAQEIWLRVQQMMKGSDIIIQEKKAKLFNEWERFTSNEGELIESYYHHFLKLINDLKRNKYFPEKIASNLKFLNNLQPEWSRHVTIVHQTKDLHTADYTQLYDFLKYNQKEVDESKAKRFAKTQDPLALMANSNNPYAFPAPHQDQLSFNQNYMQQPMPNPEDITDPTTAMNMTLNGLIGVQGNGNQNQIGNGNLVAARAEGNAAAQNGNQIRCYSCRGVGHYARNYTYDLTAAAADLDEIEKVNANCILMSNLQQASTSGTQTDNALVYDSDGSAENDNDIIYEVTGMEQGGEIVEQHPVNFEETRALYDSLYQNLAIEVKKVNSVNRKLKETNVDLTTELARFKNQKRDTATCSREREKMKQLNKEIKLANYTKINHLSGVFVPQTAKSHEELYFLNIFKMANVSKSISIPNDDFSNDTTPSVARKFLNEVKSTIVTLQCVVKHRMTIEQHNWSSSAHQELHKIINDEIFLIANQVDARVQNFEIQFLMEAAKFVGDFKSLANEADASLAKHKALELELEIKRLFKAVVSQDIMNIVQKESVVDTLDLQTELERTKEHFENCIIKKENKYDKLWNDWYKKCDECKYDKISYDKAYKDMQQKIERLQAQLGDLKVIASLENELQSTIYKNAKLRNQLFKKVSDQKDNTHDTSENTKFAKQPIMENLPKVGESHALSKLVTSNSVSTPLESKGVDNDKVITPGMFRINPFKTSREEKHVPNTVRASTRTKPITVSQPLVFTKKDVNSDLNSLSSTGVDNTKTRRPHLRSNTKHDRDVISKVICDVCKQCLISVNHDVCLRNYVNGKNSSGNKQKAKVSFKENQKKYQPKVTKPKKVGFLERLATPKPRKPRFLLRWSPTGKLFDQKGNIVDSSEFDSQSDCSNGDNACTSNTLEPKIKRFPNSTSLLGRNDHVTAILGFGDLQWGNILITRVYFVEGLGHNLFSVGQFCDSDLEVAFRRNACFVRNLEGVDLLKGNRSTNLYTINLHGMASASPICLMARASSTKSWLWHQRLSHLNFDTINDIARNDLVSGLPKFEYHKEHLCLSCEQGKSKRASHPPKPVPNSRQKLHLLHMDLCGPMRIASINVKRYVLVIVDDYSRYTWVHFLRSKDEAPKVIKMFLKRITVLLQSTVIIIRTDNGTEFKNQALKDYFDSIAISHQMSSVRIPQQNGVVERRNQTLVEAARTMLIFSRASLFLWAKAIATACFTQNRFVIHYRFNKIPYELINGRKSDILFLHVFGALCYPKNVCEDIRKLGAKGDIGFFIGSGLDLTYAPLTITTQQPSEGELDLLFEAMYDDYIGGQPSATARTVSPAPEPQSKYVLEILKKYGMESCDPVGTPMEIKDKLDLDQNGTPVNAMKYRSMIDALMYLTSSRPDIAKTTEKHLKEVKRIFRYLWGTVNTGLWYTKDSGFKLTGFSNADYAECKDTFKSTSGRAQFLGHIQEEGIDYDEVFAPVARIEAIRLFLAYAFFMRFMVYQMDVQSAFLYGNIEEEVYVCQPPGFEDPDYPDKVYKVVKALYGLHQAPRAWYETLATYLLENGFQRGTID
uniref:Retrovirus-related Pol polyprotein from transposon TNT 1-94 n=1 Tax=Tanacetum cinerariifolium TaxID=118510 RepID=A0A6L2MW53_TANCI|nr:retrovirus-related Pol polyprotein from transposon TNT 1-94 [Tanacetum cinerariifolium]